MKHATKLRLAAVLTISVAALSAGIVLADPAGDYETLFGAESKKIIASRTRTDDVEFAATLLKTAKGVPDSPALQVLLYEKAAQFASGGVSGCDTALKALGLLEEAVPDKKAQWLQKKLDVVKFRFSQSSGADRKVAGKSYMEMIEALADVKAAGGKGSEARTLYRRATAIATYIKSPRAAEILAKSKYANAIVTQETRLKSLRAKLKADTRNTAARKELICLYVAGLDKPEEAVRLLTDELDEVTRTYVPLAARKLEDIEGAICLELGDWYYKALFKNASVIGKGVVLRRARGYYQRFLGSHTKKDAQSYRAGAALESIEKELKKLDAPPAGAGLPAGRRLTLNLGDGVSMKLVRIVAGKFLMGSLKTEPGRENDEGPQRWVKISKPFYMGVTEVTQAQYEAVTGKNPSGPNKGPQNAVERVSWDDATAFCAALSKKTGRTVRLPTEAQWEYACRAGSKTAYSFGDDASKLGDYAWHKGNAFSINEKYAHDAGRKKPNAWGLYGTHGNVLEWCRDWYDAEFYENAKDVDPENTTKAKNHVVRGGAWFADPRHCRAAFRVRHWPVIRFIGGGYGFGFRVVVVSASGGK